MPTNESNIPEPTFYISPFNASAGLVTRKKLCEMLNLDTERPGLHFTNEEINKAYHKRMLQIHPDKNTSIPSSLHGVLGEDIRRARDHLLMKNDHILSDDFSKPSEIELQDVLKSILQAIQSTQKSSASLTENVNFLSYISNSFALWLFFASFNENRLGFYILHGLSETLDSIRPLVQSIDRTLLRSILTSLKELLKNADSLTKEILFERLRAVLGSELTNNSDVQKILTDPVFDEILSAFVSLAQTLEPQLTDELFDQMDSIFNFWLDCLVYTPSWGDIIAVYLTALLFTSISLPRYMYAVWDISEIIIEYKGLVSFLLISPILLATTILLLPLNLLIQSSVQVAWILLKASLQIVVDMLNLAIATFHAVSLCAWSLESTLGEHAFVMLASSINLFLRLPVIMLLETLDAFLFILTNQSWLSSMIEQFNAYFDDKLFSLQPESLSFVQPTEFFDDVEMKDSQQQNLVIVKQVEPDVKDKSNDEPIKNATENRFFTNPATRLQNKEDKWLEKLVSDVNQYNAMCVAQTNMHAI